MSDFATLTPSAFAEVAEEAAKEAVLTPSAFAEVVEVPKAIDLSTSFDLQRKVKAPVSLPFNLVRKTVKETNVDSNTIRKICTSLAIKVNTVKIIRRSVFINFDLKRKTSNTNFNNYSAKRVLNKSYLFNTNAYRFVQKTEKFSQDLLRAKHRKILLSYDLQRLVTRAGEKPTTAIFDVSRNLVASKQPEFDSKRTLNHSYDFLYHALRKTEKIFGTEFDLVRRISENNAFSLDTKRQLQKSQQTRQDLQRALQRSFDSAFDTFRKVKNSSVSTRWVYENYGTSSLLLQPANNLAKLSAEKANFGYGFYNQTKQEKLFDVDDSTEYYIRFDAYTARDTFDFRAYILDEKKRVNGVRINGNGASDSSVWVNDVNVGTFYYYELTGLHHYLIHIKAGAANTGDSAGLLEIFVDSTDEPKIIRTRNINDGKAFTGIYLQSGFSDDSVIFSDIVISNKKLTLANHATFPANCLYDITRLIYRHDRTQIFSYPSIRVVIKSQKSEASLLRRMIKDVNEIFDLDYITNKLHKTYRNDTRRTVKFAEILNLDTWRNVEGKTVTLADTVVYQPENVNIGGSIFRLSKGRIISVSIQKSVDNMSDTLTLEAYGTDFTLRDRLSGKFLDYDLSGFEVSSIRTIDKKQTITFIQNWRELASHVRFFGDGTEHTIQVKFTEDIQKENEGSKQDEDKGKVVKKNDRLVQVPSYYNTGINPSKGWKSIANAKGENSETEYTSTLKKELSLASAEYLGTDYKIIDSAKINGQTGTVLDIVNNLISWSNSIPSKLIIPFVKNGAVICLQRGYELSTTDLDNYRYPLPTLEQRENQNKLEMTYVDGTFAKYYLSGGRAQPFATFRGNKIPILAGPFTYTYSDGTTGSEPYKEINVDNPAYKEYLNKKGQAEQQQIRHPEDDSSETIDYSYSGDPETPGQYIVEEKHTLRWLGGDGRDHVKTWTVKHYMSQPQQFVTHVEVGPKKYDDKQLAGSGSSNSSQEVPPATITKKIGWTKAEAPIDMGEPGTRQDKKYYRLVYINSLGDEIVYYSESATNNLPLPFQPYDILHIWFEECKKCRIIETVALDITPELVNGEIKQQHIFGFEEKYKYKGKVYYLQSNSITLTTNSFKQSLILVRYMPL